MISNRLFRMPALIITGALQTLAFAPFYLWPAALISLVLVLLLCHTGDARTLFRDGWFLGVGLFGSGASWVYVSIHEYGMTAAPLAALMTVLFAFGLALFPAIAFWCWGRLAGRQTGRSLWLFPAIWVLMDWVRGWLLTGFPWLYAGTAQVDGPLAGWAPVLGVHGVTFITAATAALLVAAWQYRRTRVRWLPAGLIAAAALPWLLAPLVSLTEWTQPQGEPLSVAAVQGNISQHDKWDPEMLRKQIRTYRDLTEPLWGQDLILWPETALPATQGQAAQVLDALESRAFKTGTTLVTGLPWYGSPQPNAQPVFHNSLMTVGPGHGTYHKQRLVPFGEYVPLESLLRGTIEFLSLPMSVFEPGPENQSPLRFDDTSTHPAICYEIAYADFVAQNASDTGFLMTVSNDAWFGRSLGPFQHHQIARMRALETSRELLRSTNNGITSIVNREGSVRKKARHYERDTLKGRIQPVSGQTPFMATGSWPVVTLAAVMIVFGRQRRAKS